jgi:RNA polymerase sigma-70 factor (ECF subfamily)
MFIRNFRYREFAAFTDELLQVRYRQSADARFISELYGRYLADIQRQCMAYVRDEQDCEDIMMIIFEKFLHRLSGVEEPLCCIRSWLLKVARNESIDWARRYLRMQRLRQSWRLRQLAEDANDELAEPVEEGEMAMVINQLSEDQRSSIYAYYYEGKSYREIGELRGISAGRVRSHLQSGKRRLKKMLQEKAKKS